MKLGDIRTMWEADSEIKSFQIGEAAIGAAKLANKYLQIMSDEKYVYAQLDEKYKRLKRDKWEYYTGKAPADVYKKKPFNLKLLKDSVGMYIDADDDIQAILLTMVRQEEKLAYLKAIVDTLNKRHWEIKNYIDWQKFQNGGA